MIDYKSSGVDQDKAQKAITKLKKRITETFDENVLGGVGCFAPLYDISKTDKENPVLALSTDGVGTKILIAKEMGIYNTIGIDLVAMSVNDIVCQGAMPLIFLDYIAVGRLQESVYNQIISGIVDGCEIAGCSLIGGETAQMPDLYEEEDFDMAGFAVGVVDRKNIIDGSGIECGDVIIGLKSSGFHSNGFTLIRKIIERSDISYETVPEGFSKSIGEILLTPTRIYVDLFRSVFNSISDIKAVVNITGGGFYENILRVLPEGLGAEIEKNSWKVPPQFKFIQELGGVDEDEMYRVFNMGTGMVFITKSGNLNNIDDLFNKLDEPLYIIGEVVDSEEGVVLV